MRINKLFSNLGICSRKETNKLIEEKRVMVNGQLCIPGQWVEPDEYIILIDNKPIEAKEKVYMAFNKPRGIVCTAAEGVKENIINFINYPEYIFPVGRLDKESQGLIIMTNDGDLASKILESENKHEKEYIVEVDKKIDESFIEKMSCGVDILANKKIIKTRPCKVYKINDYKFNIILTQGLNRQIRKMCGAIGYKVTELKRVRIMNIELNNLEESKYRNLTKAEIQGLKSA